MTVELLTYEPIIQPLTASVLKANQEPSLKSLSKLLKSVYTENTFTAYMTDQKIFFDLVGKDIFNAEKGDILDYISKLKDKGYTSNSIARKIKSISSLLGLLTEMGFRKDNPLKILKKIHKNLIPKQIRRIKHSLTSGDIACIRALKDNKKTLLIETLYGTGCRISEILNIKKKDIKRYDELSSTVEINGKGNKSRTLSLPNTLIARIYQHYPEESEYLFSNEKKLDKPLSRVSEARKIKNLIKKITGKDASPHQLRHLYATTQIIDKQKPIKAVSKYLGHYSTSITQDMYVEAELSISEAFLV